MIGTLLATGLVVVGAGGLLSVFTRGFVAGLVSQAVGIGLVGIAGLAVFVSDEELGTSFTSEFEPHVGVDPTSGFFLFVLGAVGAPALWFATRYLVPDAAGRATGALTAVFLLVLALVLCARDPLLFLAGWEVMAASAFLVMTTEDRRRELLARASLEFQVEPADVDESLPEDLDPVQGARLLAERRPRVAGALFRLDANDDGRVTRIIAGGLGLARLGGLVLFGSVFLMILGIAAPGSSWLTALFVAGATCLICGALVRASRKSSSSPSE